MDWSNEKTLKFIEQYENEPVLWNPREEGHKRRQFIKDAWVRIKNRLDWDCSIDELKKKRDSLMAYYRQHVHKFKKPSKPGDEVNEETKYYVNWFAFSALHKFLKPVYDPMKTINVTMYEDENELNAGEDEECSSSDNEETPIVKIPRLDDDVNARAKRPRCDNNTSEISTANVVRDDDECEIFGKLITSKLRRINDDNIREILMNDIYNMVSKACVVDRLNEEGSSGLAQSSSTDPLGLLKTKPHWRN